MSLQNQVNKFLNIIILESEKLKYKDAVLKMLSTFFPLWSLSETQRTVLLNAISAYQTPSLSFFLLNGDGSIDLETNISILTHVQKFILDTSWF